MSRPSNLQKMTIGVDEPPAEFRIFKRGWNDSEHGPVLFDDAAAKAVMDAYSAHGVDRMIDLEHLSLDSGSPNFDPDARGWCRLEVRDDGSLWAVGVTWTDDGASRLRGKRQRYISPAFYTDDEKRVTKVLNIAITAMPATHGLDALVAASERNVMADSAMDEGKVLEGLGVDAEALKKALGLDAGAQLTDLAASLLAVSDKLAAVAGLAPAEVEAAEGEPAPGSEAPPPPDAEMVAARSLLLSETGAASALEALSTVQQWKKAFVELEAGKAKLAKEREALEQAERRSIGAKLVQAGLAPAMVWSDDSARTLAPLFAAQPIESLRAYAARAASQPSGKAPKPPTDDTHGLSERELQKCRARNIDPQKYAATKAATARS